MKREGKDKARGPRRFTTQGLLVTGLLTGLAWCLFGAGPAAAAECPNAQYRTAASVALPDCRAYEWVTPTLDGASVNPNPSLGAVTASGDVTFQTNDAPAGAASSPITSAVIATRAPSGWQDSSLTPPPTQTESGYQTAGGVDAVSPDQSEAVVTSDQPLVAGAPAGGNLYLREADGSYTLLTDAAQGSVPFPGLTFLPEPGFVGVSADFTHIFFKPVVPQLPQDPLSSENLYQWADGQLSIVNVLPDGSYSTQPAALGAAALPGVSADGSDVLFQENGLSGGPLYLRIDGDHTVEVDTSQRSTPDPNGIQFPNPVGITSDGLSVFFTSHSELTDDANTGTNEGSPDDFGQDLYRYDVGTGVLTDLTPDANPADEFLGADVGSVLGASPDGSYVYFTAAGDLAAGAVSGQTNLYVEHDGAVSYIADATGLTTFQTEFYVTPSGQDAAFVATGNLTGYDATDAGTGQSDAEVYEYDVPTATLTCASCRPDGTLPTGSAGLPQSYTSSEVPRVVSDDGRRVFFQSTDVVVSGAGNGLQNVYEWEADGAGTCGKDGGCVSLISPGTGSSPAELFGSSPSGDDVIFRSYDDLVLRDQTHQSALFDARVGGGFPEPASSRPCDSSRTCQGSTPPPVAASTAATVTFSGPGNARASGTVHVTAPDRPLSGRKFVVDVKVPAQGRVTISGPDIAKVTTAVPKAGTYKVAVRLTGRAKRRLARRGRLKVALKVAYGQTGGVMTTSTSVELKG